MDTVLGRIDSALDTTAAIVAAVDDDRLTAPTPCADWDVRTVLNHLVGGMHTFAAKLSDNDSGAGTAQGWLGSDPQAAYAAAAEIDRAAWRRPDVPTATLHLPIGPVPAPAAALVHLTELVVHGLDVAVAVDRVDLVDEEMCAHLLETMLAYRGIDPYRALGAFGAELPVEDDAPAHRKLLAYTGRKW
ncbi:TIGR03086 family metal-binding protein [Nocardia farcinica]|uniref:TIGR03086 family metal-binding protein n=1 Tax=Nocardia farcinica TaxID=37329 RepID=UPI001893CCCB|nr:TIGR03086 family metal-binding protein [Nocardia farcinica]MBF6295467.1 TIGR03086 family protein [Nocardia farcinica]MBF6382084.1 TIGR03086 family protein [Nocardia farcinica]